MGGGGWVGWWNCQTRVQLQNASYKLLNDQKTSQSHLNSHTSLTPKNSILVTILLSAKVQTLRFYVLKLWIWTPLDFMTLNFK